MELADICAPTYLHKALALEAFGRGLHVITEKPVALSLADAQEMYEAADRAGKQLYVAQVLQFTREVETLHEVIRDERYGKPLDACFERLSARPGWVQGSWLFQKEKSGLLPFDLHIHDLDMMVSVFGEPQSMDYTSCGGRTRPAGSSTASATPLRAGSPPAPRPRGSTPACPSRPGGACTSSAGCWCATAA